MLLCENAAAQCACSEYILQLILYVPPRVRSCVRSVIVVKYEGKGVRRSDATDLAGRAKAKAKCSQSFVCSQSSN